MLKRYSDDRKIQWVGKAWEIRAALRRLKQEKGGSTRLEAVLTPPARGRASV
ncbi:Z-ring formation inhibitor MciZ [Cohnella sp. AR92]|uniref:Z-ring formation inhibitor MciZ n=1 Tax=Cohnella sp. AR92 TaxID=648716 RepID=UPI000F8DD5A8|nr:Z-ring formation inhibitor MciZ [Cohnella sp. AR92]RUS48100.1 Z-ring formation inhibitor MciZ [Cohnella sp. AR92]